MLYLPYGLSDPLYIVCKHKNNHSKNIKVTFLSKRQRDLRTRVKSFAALNSSKYLLWRPKNFGRHFLDIQVKCK
jgi:hypothetical protein